MYSQLFIVGVITSAAPALALLQPAATLHNIAARQTPAPACPSTCEVNSPPSVTSAACNQVGDPSNGQDMYCECDFGTTASNYKTRSCGPEVAIAPCPWTTLPNSCEAEPYSTAKAPPEPTRGPIDCTTTSAGTILALPSLEILTTEDVTATSCVGSPVNTVGYLPHVTVQVGKGSVHVG